MKARLTAILLILAMLFTAALTGCAANPAQEDDGSHTEQPTEPTELDLAIEEYIELLTLKLEEYNSAERVKSAFNASRRALEASTTIEAAEANYHLALEIMQDAYGSQRSLTVNFVDRFGNHILPYYYRLFEQGEAYSVDVPTLYGFTADKTSISGEIEEDTVIDVKYDTEGVSGQLTTPYNASLALGTTVAAFNSAGSDWAHTGSLYKNYIGGVSGLSGNFRVSMFLNTKFTVNAYSGAASITRTARMYLIDSANSNNYWLYSFVGSNREAAGTKLGASTSIQPEIHEPEKTTVPLTYNVETAIALMRNSNVLLTIERSGTTLKWHATIIGGAGTGHEGEIFTNYATLSNVTASGIQIALTNRAYAEYTVYGVIINV